MPRQVLGLVEFGQDDGQQVGAADGVVEVPQLDQACFELADQADPDASAGGQMSGSGLIANEPFVGQPYRVVGGADRDAEDLLVSVDDFGGDGAAAGLDEAEVGLGEVGQGGHAGQAVPGGQAGGA